jgi:hypothetical protein
MKRTACLTLLLACSCTAWAQAPAADERGAYLSTGFGNGRIDGLHAEGNHSMRWRAFEARTGRDLNPALVGEDSLGNAKSTARIDFVYYNEGHPDNNHRDGFALQFTYTRKLIAALTAEVSAGPYTSMNTTVLDGVQRDQAKWGMLYSAALRFPLGGVDPGTHLRLGFNHVSVPGAPHSNAILLGIGRHFTDVPPFPETDFARSRLWLAASAGRSFTSMSNTHATNGAILEAKQYGGKWAVSFDAIFEGDDGTRTDRRGVAAQYWFVQPVTDRWAMSAGAGPYFAENRRDADSKGLHGIITLQFERNLGASTKAFFAFHRIKTYDQTNDRDMFHLGLQHSFGQ